MGRNNTHLGVRVASRTFLLDLNQIWISQQIFMKFHRNPSSGIPAYTSGRTDMTKPVGVLYATVRTLLIKKKVMPCLTACLNVPRLRPLVLLVTIDSREVLDFSRTQCSWVHCSSGALRSLGWWLCTDLCTWHRHALPKYQHTVLQNPKERRPGEFYIHGSVHRGSNLITVQQDGTFSVYYISVGSSTCFGCWHPSSGARTAVITASGID